MSEGAGKPGARAPGMRVPSRDAEWLVTRVDPAYEQEHWAVGCVGDDDLVSGHEAIFLTQLDSIKSVDPRDTEPKPPQKYSREQYDYIREHGCPAFRARPCPLGSSRARSTAQAPLLSPRAPVRPRRGNSKRRERPLSAWGIPFPRVVCPVGLNADNDLAIVARTLSAVKNPPAGQVLVFDQLSGS